MNVQIIEPKGKHMTKQRQIKILNMILVHFNDQFFSQFREATRTRKKQTVGDVTQHHHRDGGVHGRCLHTGHIGERLLQETGTHSSQVLRRTFVIKTIGTKKSNNRKDLCLSDKLLKS